MTVLERLAGSAAEYAMLRKLVDAKKAAHNPPLLDDADIQQLQELEFFEIRAAYELEKQTRPRKKGKTGQSVSQSVFLAVFLAG